MILIRLILQGISYEIATVKSLEKDQRSIEQLDAFHNRCTNQLADYSKLNDKVETLRNNFTELTNDLNRTDIVLTELENESQKDRHTTETAICKTHHVSVVITHTFYPFELLIQRTFFTANLGKNEEHSTNAIVDFATVETTERRSETIQKRKKIARIRNERNRKTIQTVENETAECVENRGE